MGGALLLLGACAAQSLSDSPSDSQPAAQASGPATWLSAGNGVANTHDQPLERTLDPARARQLTTRWVAETKGDVWATPAVDETSVYFPDAAGNLSALDRNTGAVRWTHRVADYTGIANDFARTTPAIAGDALFLGNQAGRATDAHATVYAVDRKTGAKLWATTVDTHKASIVTASPVVANGRVYVGISSYEEFKAPGPYQCCSFRGSVVALDSKTGQIVWRKYMTPEGYTGVGVWGSTPVVDLARGSLYVATGNNYSVPVAVNDCASLTNKDEVAACIAEVPGAEDNYVDSVIALDLATGKLKWIHRAAVYDSFNGGCILAGSAECRRPVGEDSDFGQGPILYTTRAGGSERQLLGAGQKNGFFWAINPDDGAVVWKTQVGPGGTFGGLEWGSASDGTRIYTSLANSAGQPWTMPSGEVTRTGLWCALDAATGKIVWQTRGTPPVVAAARGGVSVANGVVYGGTYDAGGTLYAFDAATGATLWTFVSNGTVIAGPAIADGTVYWGTGYVGFGAGAGRTKKLWAFAPKAGAAPADAGTSRDAGLAPDAGAKPDAGPTSPGLDTWTGLWTAYFGPGTLGQCLNCHAEMSEPAAGYDWLKQAGQIDGVDSVLTKEGSSILTWFGGIMPLGGAESYPEAARDLKAWVAAGAKP